MKLQLFAIMTIITSHAWGAAAAPDFLAASLRSLAACERSLSGAGTELDRIREHAEAFNAWYAQNRREQDCASDAILEELRAEYRALAREQPTLQKLSEIIGKAKDAAAALYIVEEGTPLALEIAKNPYASAGSLTEVLALHRERSPGLSGAEKEQDGIYLSQALYLLDQGSHWAILSQKLVEIESHTLEGFRIAKTDEELITMINSAFGIEEGFAKDDTAAVSPPRSATTTEDPHSLSGSEE